MPKRIEPDDLKWLSSLKVFRDDNLDVTQLDEMSHIEILAFIAKFGLEAGRPRRAIHNFVKHKVTDNWCTRYERMITLRNNTLEYHNLAYGEFGEALYDIYVKKRSAGVSKAKKGRKDNFPSQPGFWVKQGKTEDEAIRLAKAHNSRAGKKETCLEIYGEEEGKRIYAERQTKRESTLDANGTRRKKGDMSLPKFIERFGEEEGTQRYQSFIGGRKGKYTDEWFIKKYGPTQGPIKMAEYRKKISSGLDVLIERFGEEKGLEEYKKRHKNRKGVLSLAWYKEKYEDEDVAYEKWVETHSNRTNKTSTASKESRQFLDPLFTIAQQNDAEIYYGVDENKEYFLHNGKNIFFYDLVITHPFKMVVEYQGAWIHPRKEKMTEEEWINWKNPFTKWTADFQSEREESKKQLALAKGFEYYEIWSDDDPRSKSIELYKILEEKFR
jgi:hypothetical protein